jgi:creatinine amidohydrolase
MASGPQRTDIAPRTDRVADLTWDRIGARLAGGALAILPIGAGSKEHGLHLPMATDQIQADWLALRLAERLTPRHDTLIWPTLTYGHYPAFSAYAGSISVSRPLFEALVNEVAADILRCGAHRLMVLDTGISTIPAVASALANLPDTIHLRIHAGERYLAEAQALATQSWGGHADELETSRMLVIAPGLVDMARAFRVPGTASMPDGALDPVNSTAPTYSPTGAMGDPSLATPEKGERLLEAMLADLVTTSIAELASH